MIDFEKRARELVGAIWSDDLVYPAAAHALRQLAADVLEEAAKECDEMSAKMIDKDPWGSGYDPWGSGYATCCSDNATVLRARATAIKDGKQ
jgi:hypothetical protein